METKYLINLDGEEFITTLSPLGRGEGEGFLVSISQYPSPITHNASPIFTSPPLYSFLMDNKHVLEAEIELDTGHMNLNNVPYSFSIVPASLRAGVFASPERQHANTPTRQHEIFSPMPGKITDIKVQQGDKVTAGTALLTIEAMKMQNDIFAQSDCIIAEILVKSGQTVEAGQKLILLRK